MSATTPLVSPAIGIMEGAFFVGRTELLSWLNNFLCIDYTKIEQVCSGAVYIQCMDALFPGKVPLHKANFRASNEYEYVQNFKILQGVFTAVGIDKNVPVERLIKGKYQDNLEFLQWFKRYFDLNYNGKPYDSTARRNQCKVVYVGDMARNLPKKPPTRALIAVATTNPGPSKPLAIRSTNVDTPHLFSQSKVHSPSAQEQILLQKQVVELKLTADNLEKECDFYYHKLLEVELFTQDEQNLLLSPAAIFKELQRIM